MSLQNVYHLRTVADTSSKSCFICYKPTTAVLITPDNKDFFYVCRGHLKDRGFASPIVDDAEVAARRKKEALDKKIELIEKEYEEKQRKRKEKQKEDKDEKTEDNDKDKDKKKDDKAGKEKASDKQDDAAAEKEKDEKIKATMDKTLGSTGIDDIPRVYSLHRSFYQMRLDRIRNAELARRNRERLNNPSTFPAVPSGDP